MVYKVPVLGMRAVWKERRLELPFHCVGWGWNFAIGWPGPRVPCWSCPLCFLGELVSLEDLDENTFNFKTNGCIMKSENEDEVGDPKETLPSQGQFKQSPGSFVALCHSLVRWLESG